MTALLLDEEDERSGFDWQRVLDFAQVALLFLLFYFDLYLVPGEAKSLFSLPPWDFVDVSDVEN